MAFEDPVRLKRARTEAFKKLKLDEEKKFLDNKDQINDSVFEEIISWKTSDK